ncbi:MAG TPA: hypothetical protein PLB01_01245 [Thermoanaerobaculia bacterium]|nr:hypothetical protein [Thermoanaerobaculia bacterium]
MTALIVRTCAVAVAVALARSVAFAQAPAEAPVPPAAGANAWSVDASANTYFVPDANDFVSPVVKADRGALHLEARYNYEGFRSGSIWLGYNVSLGKELTLDLTLMLGGIFGDTAGVAPGWRFALGYGKLELTSESEYVFDSRDSANNFFFNWSELSLSLADWVRAGLVVQRTRLYGEGRDVQRGFLVGFAWKKAYATAYLFNPDVDKPSFVLTLGAGF